MASDYLQLEGGLPLLRCAGFLAIVVTAIICILHRVHIRRRYPPGPKGWPLIGNWLEMPKTHQWLVFQDWSRKFGKNSPPPLTCGFLKY